MDDKINEMMNNMNELLKELNGDKYVSVEKVKEFSKFTLVYSVELDKVIKSKLK